MKIDFRSYLSYKFLNSVFNGAVTGSVFTVYALLEPSLFSVGGIIVALGIFVVAKLYSHLMRIKRFFEVSFFTEVLTAITLIVFLLIPKGYFVSIIYFWIYQAIFIFGTYLIRVESYFMNKVSLLSMIDAVKQKGYMSGLVLSYVFYKTLEYFGEHDAWKQVWALYTGLLIIQLLIIIYLLKAFKKKVI
ncbi:MAG: hypothetical protein PHE67_08750 [Campylobacterales bacterium]|nr:hypothetical protein [Campylobacterales bacterium]